MTWTLRLAIDLPSANAHVVNGKHAATRARYREARDSYAAMLKQEARRLGIPTCNPAALDSKPLPLPPRHVELVRLIGKGGRAWDSDNLPAACKALRDAFQAERLVKVTKTIGGTKLARLVLVPGAGLVVDDSARHSTWSYRQERSHDGKPGVLVTITEGATP
jgi:hypothetical protein